MKLWVWILLLLEFIFIGLISLHADYVFYPRSSIGKINDILKFSALRVALIVSILETQWKLKDLEVIDLKMKKLEGQTSLLKVDITKYKSKYEKHHILLSLFFLVVSIVFEVRIVMGIGDSRQWTNFWLCNIIETKILRIRYLQYLSYVNLVDMHIQIMRDELAKIRNSSYQKYLSNDPLIYEESLEKLEILKKFYGSTWDVVNDINDFFLWSITANIVTSFFLPACDIYWTYDVLMTDRNGLMGLFELIVVFSNS